MMVAIALYLTIIECYNDNNGQRYMQPNGLLEISFHALSLCIGRTVQSLQNLIELAVIVIY